MPFVTQIAATIGAFAGALTNSLLIGKTVMWTVKAGILFAANFLLSKRPDSIQGETPDRLEVFASGPARWVVGRRKVGGVVMYWGEDYNVPETEGGGGPGADDLHLVIAVSEGSCDAIEAIWIAGDRLEIKFEDDAKTVYRRRGARTGDSTATLEGLPLDLDPGAPTWWDSRINRYRETEGGRLLDPGDEDDAELIRRADLSGAVNVYPWLVGGEPDRWKTVRTYTDRADSAVFGRPTPFTDWTTNHRLDGVAGLHIRLRQWTKHNFDERVFRGSVPDLAFLIRGQRITYPDPDRTTGTVTRWTNNAAAVRYWWHTVRRGIDAANIDRDAFVEAFNVCDAVITPSLPETWPNDEPPDWAEDESILSFRRYSIDGVVTSGDDASRIEAEFDDAWQGFVVEEGGALLYYPGSDRVSQPVQIESADLLDLPSWQPAPSIADRTNAVTLSIVQSSFHDFNNYALREIVDTSKRDDVDEGLHLPQDLGSWRWTINPAQAYSLGAIALRRARHSGALTVRLPPGTADDPIGYLAMTPGHVYSVNIPEELFEGRRMLLVDKQIEEEMVVVASFVEAPIGLYAPTFQLPDVPTPPAHIPTEIGTRPRKPTGLAVDASAQVSDDGSVYFRIEASVDESSLRKVFRLIAGSDRWEIETPSDSHVFAVNVPRQPMEVTARHIDKDGVLSLPVRKNFTPDYDAVVLPRPNWEDVVVYGANLRLIFDRVFYGSPIAGVEIRYTRLPLGSNADLPILTASNWTTGAVLGTEPVQIVRGLDINVTAIAPESGRYGLFARFVAKVSGAEPVRGPLSYLRDIEVEIPEQPVSTIEEAPLFAGGKTNLVKWIGRVGSTAGEALLFPSSAPASDLLFDHWNGWVPDSAITAHPLPRWPFGQCEGYGQALTATRDSFGIVTASPATVYTTPPIDLGISKRVEVKHEVFAYIPGTDRQSNLTFGSHSISDQRWGAGAISPVVLPEASQGIGAISYSIAGLPAGLSFAAATRTVSGAPLVNSASGSATYTATDAAGGRASIDFSWTIGTNIETPGAPSGLATTTTTTNTADITWTAGANASSYEVERATAAAGPWTSAGSTVETAFRLTGLTESTTYYIRVRGKNGGGVSAWSGTLSFTTSAATVAPGVPTGLAEEAKTQTSITVDWTSALGVQSYEVRWKWADLNTYADTDIATGLYSTEHTVTGLSAGTPYDIQVRARNSAGASDWSDEVEITTLQSTYAAPTISTLAGIDAVQDYLKITMGAYSNLNSYEFEVTADPADGTHSSTARTYTLSPPGPYQIYNVKRGTTYSVRARAIVQGGAMSLWTAWSSLVFRNVPSVVQSLTGTTTATSASLTWTASLYGSPTSYRVDWWALDEPDNVLFTESIATTSTTISGLTGSKTYRFEVRAANAAGLSLPALVELATSTPALAAPSAPTDRRAMPISDSVAWLQWSEVEGATTYEVRHVRWGFSDFHTATTGLTKTTYHFAGLTAGTQYTIQVRARNSAGESAWVDFPQVSMPPAPASDFAFDTTAPLSVSKGSNRTIAWSLTTTVDAGVAGFQIRYRQNPDAKSSDNVVPSWVYEPPIGNTHASGQRTFTGVIDPGFSLRYYEVQVRAHVDTAISGGSTVGLSAWAPCSSSENTSIGGYTARNLTSTIRVGELSMTPPTFTVSQRDGSDGNSTPLIDFVADASTYETAATIYIQALSNFPPIDGIDEYVFFKRIPFATAGQVEFDRAFPTGTLVADPFYLEVQESGSILAYRRQPARSALGRYTVLPAGRPTSLAAVTEIDSEFEENDVTFSWPAVPGAVGYEVRLTENDVGELDVTISYIAQTGAGRDYEKLGGRNEHFRISIRAYAGTGADRIWSAPKTHDHSPPTDAYSVGKVTGLVEDPIGQTTRIRWRPVPNADGYQYQENSSGSWSSAATTTSASVVVQSSGSFTFRVRGYRGSGAARVYGLAWSAIAHREFTNPSGAQVGDVENVVAIDRGNDVVLDWDDVVPNAGRFRIERQPSGGSWAVVQASVSNTTTAWATDDDATVSATYRIRGETDESNGAWTEIEWTGSTLIPVAAVPHIRAIARQESIELRWDFPDGIYRVEYRYRKNSDSAWTVALADRYVKHVVIDDLEDNTAYRYQLRAVAGDRRGPWTPTTAGTIDTIDCSAAGTPTSLSLERIRTAGNPHWFSVRWDVVDGATSYGAEADYSSDGTTWTFLGLPSTINQGTPLRGARFNLPAGVGAPIYLRVRIKAFVGECAGDEAVVSRYYPASQSEGAQEEAEGAVAAGSGASVSIPAVFGRGETASSSPLARPWFAGHFDERCFLAGAPIEPFVVPPPNGGLAPYTVSVTGLPPGLAYDAATRTVSGTPTGANPDEGYASFLLTDANGAFDRRSLRWILAGAVPQSWSQFGGGFGSETNPFQIECTTRGNVRPFYFRQGGTNAADIEAGVNAASAKVLWLRCPTTYAHTARILGASAPDYDLVVKVGADHYFSDTTDDIEFVRVPGDANGALIGVYRYESTTTSTGANNAGDPLILEWYPDIIDPPADDAGDEASGFSGASSNEGAVGANTLKVPGVTDTDVYLLHRNGKTGAWTRQASALGAGWNDVGTNAREVRLEFHFKRWENRAIRRITTLHRDKT